MTPYFRMTPREQPIDYDLLAKRIADMLKEKKEG
jgi:hypothetical protein